MRFALTAFTIVAAISLVAGTASAGTYTVDNSNSSIGWTGSKVTGSHDGGFNTFTGTIEMPSDDFTEASIDITIDMASIYSDADQLTQHLRTDDFFAVGEYPEASFTTTAIEAGQLAQRTHTITGDPDDARRDTQHFVPGHCARNGRVDHRQRGVLDRPHALGHQLLGDAG